MPRCNHEIVPLVERPTDTTGRRAGDLPEKQAKGAVCGRRNADMVLDHETGMECCRGCADMPAE